MHDRIVVLEGVCNFRDFGGYPTEAGGVVARGVLYRSAHLAGATAADCARIGGLGVRVLADLRRPSERDEEPNAWPVARPGVDAARVIAHGGGAERSALPPHLLYLRDGGPITPEAVDAYMTSVYRDIIYKERYVALFRDVFASLLEEPLPTDDGEGGETGGGGLLVHCAAGKDRTGLLCALILDALGVAHEDVVADYEFTNDALNLTGVIAQAAPRISRRVGRALSEEEIRPLAGVSRRYLEVAWETVRARSGSLEAYRREVLGVGPDETARLRARLVRPG